MSKKLKISDSHRLELGQVSKIHSNVFLWRAPVEENQKTADYLFENLQEQTRELTKPYALLVDASQCEKINLATQNYIKTKFTGLSPRPSYIVVFTGKNTFINSIAKHIARGVLGQKNIAVVQNFEEALKLIGEKLSEHSSELKSFKSRRNIRLLPILYASGGVFFGLLFPILALFLESHNSSQPWHQLALNPSPLLYIIFTAPFFLGLFAYFIGIRERALRVHGGQFSDLILNSAVEGIYGIDLGGKITFVNPAAEKLLGYQEAELIGLAMEDKIQHFNQEQATEEKGHSAIYKTITEGESVHIQHEYFKKKDGSTFPVEYFSNPISSGGKTVGAVVTFIDISERTRHLDIQKTTSAIRQNYMKYQQDPHKLYDHILNSLLKLTKSEYGLLGEIKTKADGKRYLKTLAITNIAWNEETRNFYNSHQATGLEFYNLETLFGYVIKKGDPVITNNAKGDHRSAGLPPGHPPLEKFMGLPIFHGKDFLAMIGLANGREDYSQKLYSEIKPILDATADILALEKKEFEVHTRSQELNIQKNFLQGLIHSLPLAMFCKDYTDGEGRFINWNKGAEKLWGLKEGDVLGKSDFDFFPREQAVYFQQKDRETLRKQQGVFIEEEPVDSPEVGRRYVRTWKVPLHDNQGNSQYLLGISLDITELKLLSQDLEQQKMIAIHASKMASMGEMAGGIAHEINNPLAIIHGYAHKLQRSSKKGALTKEMGEKLSQKISVAVKRIWHIVEGLRTFSRDGITDPFESYEIGKIVNETLNLYREQFRNLGITLNLKPEFMDTVIECRRVPILQVITNLLNNARQAVSEIDEKWVTIDAQKESEILKLRVTDSGPGIPKEIVSKLFQPLFTTNEIGKGPGLGLSICKGLIEEQGGTIYVDTQATNTRFVIELNINQNSFTDRKRKVA